jgi:hypothetical protein
MGAGVGSERTPRSAQSAFISEEYPAMVKPIVEKMVNANADAMAKNGRAEENIAKGNNDALRLVMRDQQIGVIPEGRAASAQSFLTAIASQRLRPTRRV